MRGGSATTRSSTRCRRRRAGPRPRTRGRGRRRPSGTGCRCVARARSRPPWRGLLLAGAGVAAVVTLVVVARGVQRARPLTYVGGGRRASRTATSVATSDGASQVRFSDGTHVDLAQGARVSVLSRGPRGARLRVEEGEARFDVVHLPHAAWSVEAGPVRRLRDRDGVRRALVGRRRGDRGAHAIGIGAGGRAAAPRAGDPARRAASDRQARERRAARSATRARAATDAPPPRRARPRGRRRAGRRRADPAGRRAAPPASAPRPRWRRAPPRAAPALPPSPLAAPAPPRRRRRRQPPRPRPRRRRAAAAAPSPAVRQPSIAHRAAPRVDSGRLGAAHVVAAITSGDAARVVEEAEAHGLDKTLLEVDSTALSALADAARYSGRPEVAVRALIGRSGSASRRRRSRTRPRSSWAGSPTIAARSRRGWRGTAAISPRRRRGRTRPRRWDGRCSRSSGSRAAMPRAASPANTSSASRTGRTCCRRTRSSRTRAP